MPDADSAIVVLRSIVDKPLRNGARVVPENLPILRVQVLRLVGRRYEQDSIDNHGSNLEPIGVRRMKNPLRAKLRNVARVNFAESTVSSPRIVAVIGKPIRRSRRGY